MTELEAAIGDKDKIIALCLQVLDSEPYTFDESSLVQRYKQKFRNLK